MKREPESGSEDCEKASWMLLKEGRTTWGREFAIC